MPGSKTSFKVAAVQMTSTAVVERNVAKAMGFLEEAAAAGADLIAFPENFAFLVAEGSPVRFRQPLEGELVGRFAEKARRLGRWILLGSIPEAVPGRRKVHNTSVLLGPDGKRAAVYRKLHLFDIRIRGGAVFQESRRVAAGDRPVLARTPLGVLGLSICYDLRFPELYRRLALGGAEVLLVPAAFTAYTGRDHWLPLLRARAIENVAWVVAPAQTGRHGARRSSHGETVVIDPWGRVVACRPTGEGWILAEIDRRAQAKVREGLPCLDHVRPELLGLKKKQRRS